MIYKVIETKVSPVGVLHANNIITTEDYVTARYYLLKKHSHDIETYEGRPCYRTRDEYVIKPDKYTTIDVRIEVEHASN